MRLSYSWDAIRNRIEILDRNDYYPFGMNFVAAGAGAVYDPKGSPLNYKFGTKELQETGFYDFGARMLMPDIGRWFTVDPLAEKNRKLNPYHYAANNPIRNIDPDGRMELNFTGESAKEAFVQLRDAQDRRNSINQSNKSFQFGEENGGLFGKPKASGPDDPFVFMIGGADLAWGLMGKSNTTLNIENKLKKKGLYVSSYNHDYFGSNKNVTKGSADYIAAQYSILKNDVILYGYSRGAVEIMEVARLLDKKGVPIKLMILVDAANGPASDKVNRTIPGNVQNVINYYQTDGSTNPLGSHGGAAIKTTGATTNIQNFDVTGSYYYPGGSYKSSMINHSNIDEAYRDEVLFNILKYKK